MTNIYNEYNGGIIVDVYKFTICDSWRFFVQLRTGVAQGDRVIHETLLEDGTDKPKAIR